MPDRTVPAAVRLAAAAVLGGLCLAPHTADAADFNVGNRWTRTATDGGGMARGDAMTLTWGIVPDGTPTFGGRSSNLLGRLDAVYGSGPGGDDLTQRPWFNTFESAYARYEGKVGIRYVYAGGDDGASISGANGGELGVRGDIRVAGLGNPFPFPALGFNQSPLGGGDTVLNTGAAFFSDPSPLRGITMHEHAHGLGLSHSNPRGDLPPTVVQGSGFNGNGPQYDDLLGLHRLYGDALELDGGNDTISTATSLGNLAVGTSTSRGSDATEFAIGLNATDIVSIDGTSDNDVYRFTVDGRSQANIILSPVGPTYTIDYEGRPPETINGKQQANLAYDIYNADNVLILSSDRSDIGGNETYLGFRAPAAGDYYVRVRSTDDQSQFYQLDVAVNATAAANDANLLLVDNFDLPGSASANGANSFRLASGRQASGVIESAFGESTSDDANTTVSIVNDKLTFTATGDGDGASNQTLDVLRNVLPEVEGQRWQASFELDLSSQGNVSDGWFGVTFNDQTPIGIPFLASAEMSMLIREDGRVTVRENGTDGASANVGSGPFDLSFIVDETGVDPTMTVLVNDIAVLQDEVISLNDLGRYFSFTLHNGGSSEVGSVFTGAMDNLRLEILVPEPATVASLSLLGGLLLRRRR